MAKIIRSHVKNGLGVYQYTGRYNEVLKTAKFINDSALAVDKKDLVSKSPDNFSAEIIENALSEYEEYMKKNSLSKK